MEYEVKVRMTKDTVESALSSLYENEQYHLDELARVRDNIKVLAAVLSPVTKVGHVSSESNPFGAGYDVTSQNGVFSCTCPSFKFQRGLDDDGYCKHIRKFV